MVGIKLLLLSSLLFVRGIRGYCVYNKLTDGSSFKITQSNFNTGAHIGRAFSKHLEKDTTECCPYTSRDCSIGSVNDEVALFSIELFFIDQLYSVKSVVTCTTGGGFTILGTKENYYAECTNAKGVTAVVPL
ncbi:hypothetical protein EDC94DRAFT_584095 [Helicostylum pulchrum]|nr:hypothetical protein EDC94DRAFT_584095 [Helicostylum pulchrum]